MKIKKLYSFLGLIIIIGLTFSVFFILNRNNNVLVVNHRLQWWLEDINWDTNRLKYNGAGVKIAVIDTGIDNLHPDLKGKIISEYRVKDLIKINKLNDFEHGTNVCGIICANPHDKNGVLGIAPSTQIISIDISDDKGIATMASFVEAIDYAINNKVDIINISIGIKKDFIEVHNAIKRAYDSGIVLVAAASNDIKGSKLYPAVYNEVLCADSYNKIGEKLSANSYGKKIIYLPGENIVTTNSSYNENRDYTSMTGTSFSTPILTGIIALIIQSNNEISNKNIIDYFNNYNGKIDVIRILKQIENKK